MTRHPSTHRTRLVLHPTRAAILATVHGAPGILMSQLRRRIHCSPGTIQHHVRLLEEVRFIRCIRTRRRCRIFPAEAPVADHEAMVRLCFDRVGDGVGPLPGWPRAAPRDAAQVVEIRPPALHHLADRLGALRAGEGTSLGDGPAMVR